MKTIKILGCDYPIEVNINTTIKFCKAKKIEIDEFGKLFENVDLNKPSIETIENTALLIQCAVSEGIRKHKTEQQLPDIEDVLEMFSDGDELAKFYEAFAESMPEEKPNAQNPNVPGPKKRRRA